MQIIHTTGGSYASKRHYVKKTRVSPPHITLAKAAEQMHSHDYGFIPVGENDRLLGAERIVILLFEPLQKVKILIKPH